MGESLEKRSKDTVWVASSTSIPHETCENTHTHTPLSTSLNVAQSVVYKLYYQQIMPPW